MKALDSVSSSSASVFDGLPREDISSKITPTMLKNLGSPDWKVRNLKLIWYAFIPCFSSSDVMKLTYVNW